MTKIDNLSIREATVDDAKLYYDWANDPVVRKMAFHSEPIPWDNHIRWFKEKVASPKSHLLLCYYNNQPVGQVRFDVQKNGEAEIDISIAKEFRSKGFGKQVLSSAVEYEKSKYGISAFVSEVKVENVSSQKTFLAVGFILGKTESGVCYFYKNI